MVSKDPSTRKSLLLIHDDSDLLDALTRTFEARGFEVAIAATPFAAISRIDAGREFDAIIAGWSSAEGVSARVYEWALRKHYHLRGRFLFVSNEPTEDFEAFIRGRCLLLDCYDFEEIVRITETLARRSRQRPEEEFSLSEIRPPADGQPSLLLVEDEPLQLTIMQMILANKGFAVTPAESGKDAIAELKSADYDVILSDWYMGNGSGGDLYEWLLDHRPHLAERCVFMSASNPGTEFVQRVADRPFVPKGQDSPTLVHHLTAIAEKPRPRA